LSLPRVIPDRALLETQALVTLAGRATDEILGNGPSAGAAEDLREATRIMAAVHGSFGLGQNLVHRVDPGEAEKWVRYDAKAAALIEDDLRRLMRRATVLVSRLGPAIREVAAALLARRTLTGEEVTHLAGHPLPAALPPLAEPPTGPRPD
jgi:ATP-dependent Zn protease